MVFVYMNYHLSERSFTQNMQEESNNLYQNYQTLLTQTYNSLLTIGTFISSDLKVQQIFSQGVKAVKDEGGGAGGIEAQKSREALIELVGAKWQAVQEKFGARQLHFHLGPGSTSFLRIHKPDKFGDNMDNVRFTIVDTNKNSAPVTGFETGRVYSGLRGVVPVTTIDPILHHQVHLGALEIGTSFDAILNILHETSNFSAGVLLTKEHIRSAMWPHAIESKFGSQGSKCECVIEATSGDNFKDIIEAARAKGIRFINGGHEILQVGEHNFLVSYFPLRDYQGLQDKTKDDAGAVVFWKDVDEPLQSLQESHRYNVLYGVVGFLLVELLFWFTFRFGTRHLENIISLRTQELRVNQEKVADVIWATGVGIWEWNVKDNSLFINGRWAEILGYSVNELSPLSMSSWEMLTCPEDVNRFREGLSCVIAKVNQPLHMEVRFRHRDGHMVWVLIKGRSVEKSPAGDILRVSGSCADISSRKESEIKIHRLATFDSLTGLFNRSVFNEKLNEAIQLSRRTQHPFCLMMLDLDGFKEVNDEFGHPAGDTLLQLVAKDLKGGCRESDLVARLGGDEFALILLSTSDAEGAKAFGTRLLEALSKQRMIDGHSIQTHASIGCCMYGDTVSSVEAMVKEADAAMYKAKHQGKNTVCCSCC